MSDIIPFKNCSFTTAFLLRHSMRCFATFPQIRMNYEKPIHTLNLWMQVSYMCERYCASIENPYFSKTASDSSVPRN